MSKCRCSKSIQLLSQKKTVCSEQRFAILTGIDYDLCMQKIIVTGKVDREPVLRYTQTGKAITGFTVCSEEQVGDRTLKSWFKINAWETHAEPASRLQVGQMVTVEGRVGTETYVSKDGETKAQLTVSVLSIRPGAQTSASNDNEPF